MLMNMLKHVEIIKFWNMLLFDVSMESSLDVEFNSAFAAS